MAKTQRTSPNGVSGLQTPAARDLRALLHVPQHDLQAQMASRLERLGFPSLRPVQVQLLSALGPAGLRLSDLVSAVSLPKQTVGDLIDDLEGLRLVERFADPDHGVIKRVRLGPRGKIWAAEMRRVAAATEARWASQLGSRKMKSLRALLEELAATVETPASSADSAAAARPARAHRKL